MPYLVQCWNCLGEFDALEAIWCGDSSTSPTKICPFCLQCFCSANPAYKEHFWEGAPDTLREEMRTLNESRQRIGALLVQDKKITPEELLAALDAQKKTRKRLGEILVEQGRLRRSELETYLRRQKTVLSADLTRASIHPELIRELGIDFCHEKRVLPLAKDVVADQSVLTLAMANTSDGETLDEAQRRTGCRVIPEAASEEDILGLLRNLFPRAADSSVLEETPEQVRTILMDLLRTAVRRRAGHLHIESMQTELWVFFRIDGVLYRVRRLPKRIRHLLMQEIRTLVHHPEGTPFEHGRTQLRVGEGRYSLVVLVRHGEQGENVLLRLVNVEEYGRSFEKALGDAQAIAALQESLRHRSGLLLVTSPLFHGRRETLYAGVGRLRDLKRSPLFLEGVAAAPLPGVTQVELSVEEAVGRLEALKEAPPPSLGLNDLLAAGTAQAVLEVARNTLVVASLRAGSVSQALVILLEWGLPGLDLADILRLVTCQRQVRRLCPVCRVPDASAESRVLLGLSEEEVRELQPMTATGCPSCQRLGSYGRVTISEALPVDGPVRALIAAETAPEQIYSSAVEHGMVPLRQAFLTRVREGVISLQEFEKVLV